MTARFAIIEGDLVANVVLSSGEFAQEQGWVACPDDVSPGWTWDGLTFAAPVVVPVVPAVITMRQARLALLGAGMLAAVDAAISSMPSPMKEAAQIEWEFATEVRRQAPLILQLGPALGLTDAQIDALFIAGAGV